MMTALWDLPMPELASARSRSGSARPPSPSAPIFKKQRCDFVAKTELGTKRVCPTTGRKFYDLNKDPIISPYTGMVVPVAPIVLSRAAAHAEAKAAVPEAAEEEIAADEPDVELVSLEEADEDEAAVGGKKPGADDDLGDLPGRRERRRERDERPAPLEPGDRLCIQAASESITLLHPTGHDYYKLLRSKLHWGRGSFER